MDNSHAPFPSPVHGSQNFFIGYLSACLESRGQITPADWDEAVNRAAVFQREQEIDIQP